MEFNEINFISFAASLLEVDAAKLSLKTKYGELPEWDSVAHIRLVMETEKKFGVYYNIEKIPALLTFEDFLTKAETPE